MSDIPLTNFHFQVDWEGDRVGFTEVTGLSLEHQVIEYREGTDKTYSITKVPGLKKYGNVVLKRGMYLGDDDFYDWWKKVHIEEVKRTITIKHLNEEHKPDVVWILRDAWPVSVNTSRFHGYKSGVLIERLEVAHHGLTIQHL